MTSLVHSSRTLALLLLAACSSSGGTPAVGDASTSARGDGSANPDGQGDGDGQNDGADGADGDGSSDGDGDGDGDGSDGPDGGESSQVKRTFVFVGGWDYGNATDYPFRSYTLNRSTGALTQVGDPVNLGPNPSFIAPSKDGRFLYVANERGDANGGVTVAEVNLDSGALTKRDHETTNTDFVFTSLDPAGKYVLAASYGGGNVSVFPINDDGTLDGAVDTQSFGGGAQSHSIRVHASGNWAFVPNKGLGSIAQLAFLPASGKLDSNPTAPKLDTGGGSEPRHIAFDPAGKRAYVMFEAKGKVGAYDIALNGTLSEIEVVPSVPDDFKGANTGAHVLVHPSGKYVYASNRGHDSIAVFGVDLDGGLTLIEHEPTRGETPRNFDIDSEGELMVVANQDSNTVAVYRIGDDGRLDALGDLVTGLQQPNAVAIVNVK